MSGSFSEPLILLTGATGYVGGRLLPLLEARNIRLRCMARSPQSLATRVAGGTEVVRGDVLDPPTLEGALKGVHTAYYLIHSMGSVDSFEETDRRGAANFAAEARRAGVQRIVYLGGLGDEEEALSAHLRSRHEVGEVLRASGVPVVEFRASIVIGSGSLSFEMIRSLVERLPIMITPTWIDVPAQPIAIEDLLAYLIAALDLDEGKEDIFEIGGADVVSYAEIMKVYARQRNLTNRMIRVPVLTPRLSSLWLGLVTPLYARVGRKLIESIVHPTVVLDDIALGVFPVNPMGVEEGVRRALSYEDARIAATRWSDALSAAGEPRTWGGVKFGSRLIDSRTESVPVPPELAFRPVERIGGQTGWYAWNRLWRLRGFMDTLAGGVGMRRGRNDPEALRPGDTLDFWRVESVERPRQLRLAAEMKVPGRAWLEFEIEDDGSGGSVIRQTAVFDPIGLFGRVYWYVLYPLHELVFGGMLKGIAREAAHLGTKA